MVLSVPPPVQSKVVASLLDQIAAELSQDQNLIRIKKLLLYVCTRTWENDRQRLARAPLNQLLQQLFETSPTFEQLQHRLNQVVVNLNKSAEYTIVANTIGSRFRVVYSKLEQNQPTANQAFYEAVVERLQREPDEIRIKKLLLLTCRNTWENNSKKLAQLNLLDLVQELHQIAPTIESLTASLTQVSKALSKPKEYTQIAAIISNAFQSCYEDKKAELSHITEWLTEPVYSDMTFTSKVVPHRPPCVWSCSQNGDQNGNGYSNGYGDQLPKPTPKVAPQKVLMLTQPQKIADLFNLRLEIMQDTNPLRAKILLFSLLHEHYEGSAEHDAFLRSHELDDLLRAFFLSYRLYSEAENQLRQIAKSLVDDYLQVADAILRAIQPFYTQVELIPNLVVMPMKVLPTDITNMKVDTNEVTFPECY
jgi:hypothetical protein